MTTRLLPRGRWTATPRVTALLLCLFAPGYALAQSPTIAQKARASIVYIYFDVINSQTGIKGRVQGTGFVVSSTGYVLTAAHIFKDWRQQTDASKAGNPILATRFDKPGFTKESALILQPINLGEADAEDVALLKLPDIEPYETAAICLNAGDRVQMGDSLWAFGFPADQNFQQIPGTFGTHNAPGGRWAATSAFTEGMSGGPVYNTSGFVVGLIKGGLTNTDAVRYVTPIRHASPRLTMAGAPDKCAPASPAAQPLDVEDVLWAFVQENYSLQSASSFLKRFPNGKYKAEVEKRMASADKSAGPSAANAPEPPGPGDAAGSLAGGVGDQFWKFPSGEPQRIAVCWEDTGDRFAAEREWVRTAISESWQMSSNLRFVGWVKCQLNQNAVRIGTSDSSAHTKAIGPKVAGIRDGVVLNFEFKKWSSVCQSRRESCIRSVAVHEFGHVLGFLHENNRPDAPLECRMLASGQEFTGKLITPYDADSVMNFCNPVWNNNGVLSALDKEKVRIIYGQPNSS